MMNRSASLAISTSVLKALPGKLDIKRHSPSILYLWRSDSQVFRKTCQAHGTDGSKDISADKPTSQKPQPSIRPLVAPRLRQTKASKPPPVATKPKHRFSYNRPFQNTSAHQNSTGASGLSTDDVTLRRRATIPARNTPEFCMYMYTSEICPPAYWTKYTSDKSIKTWKIQEKGKSSYTLVDVDRATFAALEGLVKSTWLSDKHGYGHDAVGLKEIGYNKLKVTKIQRVENLTLYENYKQMQQDLFHHAGEGITCTMRGSRKFSQRGSKFDVFLFFFF